MRGAHRAILVAIGSLLASLVVALPASAATRAAADPTKGVPVTGTAANGDQVAGKLTVVRFVSRNHAVWAIARFNGQVTDAQGNVVRHGQQAIMLPVQLPGAGGGAVTGAAAAQATCQVLDLTLGPLDLNLLGLHVHLNQVVLHITAESGPGALLGNLLCAVAGLLNQNPPVPANLVSQLLNVILGVLRL